ncbi:alpha/beta hydrolase, partial [Achromobacter xylosoxidans]|nr:alpha/beta hydrolase [Achromobacter xylosoxidans]
MPPQLVLLPGMDGTGDLFDPLLSALPPAPPPNLRGLILCASFVRAPHPRLGLARPLANWLPVTLLPRAV